MASTVQLTNRDNLKLHEGLAALDGVADKDGKVARFDFDFDLAYNVSKNRRIVEDAAEIYQRAKKTLGATHGVLEGMKVTPENAAAIALFIDEDEKLQAKTIELTGILKMEVEDLKKLGIKIPGILKNLAPIIDDK